MSVTYTTAVKNTRLNAVTTAIGTTGVLEIGTTGMATVLATIPLANPAAPAASGGVLSFTMPASDTAADATGTAAVARIRTASGGTDIVTGLTVGTTGTDIVLDSVSITAGQTVTITSAAITHA
ncbi:hypothetical protein UFOVP121_40 [uncultured Caudovirales phage]|uniref:Uncharacterized protein n=1 Tax=uncultured Caudovirales phage TaxID=2100421 RepID=A0A6J5LPG0_9CAUD|nr:hypothetical protein UFOVP121_40 [uncultured Caudovirales phage]CAB4134990.1 hypothetical protein UFOVP277_45 [uncultured Caudovirales phage]